MKSIRNALSAVGAASAMLLAPQAAQAGMTLCLDDGVGGFNGGGLAMQCIVDGSAADVAALAGLITFNGAYGSYMVNVSTAIGEPLFPGYGMDLASVNLGYGTLMIAMSQTDMQFGSGGLTNFIGRIGGTSQGNVSYELYADDSNTAFGRATQLMSGSGSSAFSASGGGAANVNGTFSLSTFVTIRHWGLGLSSFDFEAQVPEPGSLALLGAGLLAAGAASRRRKSGGR